MLKVVGKALNNWESLSQYLTEVLNLKGEFKFYGVNYGWALRYKKSGKSIVALYPDKDCFNFQIILNKKQVESALSQELGKGIVEVIRDKEYLHEGKWIYLNIDDTTKLMDIKKLINIRIDIK